MANNNNNWLQTRFITNEKRKNTHKFICSKKESNNNKKRRSAGADASARGSLDPLIRRAIRAFASRFSAWETESWHLKRIIIILRRENSIEIRNKTRGKERDVAFQRQTSCSNANPRPHWMSAISGHQVRCYLATTRKLDLGEQLRSHLTRLISRLHDASGAFFPVVPLDGEPAGSR